MKPEFQRWYEAVQLTLDPQVMEARWAALQALAESINDAELEALARAAFRSDQTTAATATVRTKLADKGGAMADEEFALLAAAALAVILQRDEPAAARAATMICTAHFKNLRTLRQPMDLVGLGATARVALARTSRRRPPLELEPMPSLEVDTTPAEETEDSNESIRLLAGAFTEAMQQIADRQADFEERALRYISIQDEELNMLWWLQGGRTQAGHMALGSDPGGVQQMAYSTTAQPSLDRNTVDLDRERAAFVDNSVRYEAALRFINGQAKTLLSAIQGQ